MKYAGIRALFLMAAACSCVLGHHYINPDDPADCHLHGRYVP